MRAPFALAVLIFSGCASAPRIVVEPHVGTVRHLDPLDVRFAQVDIVHMPMLAAAEALSTKVRKVYGERFAPQWAYTAGPFPGVPERPVTVHAEKISFRQLMNEFCRQTHWQYRVTGWGRIEFQSGPVPGYQPEIRRPRPNQSLQPTALWRCASMSILISVFSVGATPRPQSSG